MKVYFFDNSRNNLAVIKRIISQCTEEDCRFFVNKSLTAFFDDLKLKEETVIFIDTRMHAGQRNSFDLAVKIRERNENCHIIFMSSYPQDMCFCFKNLIRPSGFLLKPIDGSEITALLTLIGKSQRNKMREGAKIFIKSSGSRYAITPEDVMFFSTFGKKISCKTIQDETIEFYSTLKEIEAKFSEYFIRCHSGFLANKKMIVGMTKNGLTLKNCSETLPVSKKYKACVNEYLKSS